jgi:EmrB/QacA subfamily drug resistance transporter
MVSGLSPQRTRWWALAALSITQLMVALDATVINIALPRAQIDLSFSNGNRQWLISAYALAFGSLMLLGGRLSDLWGQRNALIVGLVGFATASGLGGYATTFTQLVIARAVQGAFGALLAPAALAALTTTFRSPQERAKAFTTYGAIGGSGAAIGLLLGGALTQWATWRWCLYINVAFAVIALIGVFVTVEADGGRHATQLDLPGALAGSAGLFALVFGFAHAVTSGWSDVASWGSLTAAGLLLVGFAKWQGRATQPLLPLRIVRQRTRGGSLVALFITSVGIFGISLFLAYYLENVLHDSPLRTGVLFMPLVIAMLVSATVASARLLSLVGPRPLVPVGMVLAMMGMILFTRLTPTAPYLGEVVPGLVLTGLGLGLIFAPAVASATSGIHAADAGAASALVNTTQQIGGSVGTALLNTIAVSASNRFWHAHAATLAGNYARGIVHGDANAFWWAAGFFGLGAVVTFFMLESGVPELEGDVVPLI